MSEAVEQELEALAARQLYWSQRTSEPEHRRMYAEMARELKVRVALMRLRREHPAQA